MIKLPFVWRSRYEGALERERVLLNMQERITEQRDYVQKLYEEEKGKFDDHCKTILSLQSQLKQSRANDMPRDPKTGKWLSKKKKKK